LKFWILLGLFLVPSAEAKTLILLTDESSGKSAEGLKSAFLSTPPFSRMKDLEIKVVVKESARCEAWKGPATNSDEEKQPGGTARILHCNNSSDLATAQAENNGDYLIFVKNDPTYRGGGGNFPTMTTGSPALMGVHEFIHTLGFADEYSYPSAFEADMYCGLAARPGETKFAPYPGLSFNIAVFEDHPPYASDSQARSLHGGQIPWFGKISASTLITSGGQLGTARGKKLIGLYPAKTCIKSTKQKKSWQPGEETTLMESLSTNYLPPAYWDQIALAMGTTISGPSAEESVSGLGKRGARESPAEPDNASGSSAR
jgi:hypothetical protein